MALVKLTKTELRAQANRLNQLTKYLPTLQLKKALLQVEVQKAALEVRRLSKHFDVCIEHVERFAPLLTSSQASTLHDAMEIETIETTLENIAGVEIPLFEKVVFKAVTFSLYTTPVWMEHAILQLQELISFREKIKVAKRCLEGLEKELREVSIRVNLFEKIMIPRALENMRKIKIFLGDQALAAVAQAKVSKEKILARKEKATA